MKKIYFLGIFVCVSSLLVHGQSWNQQGNDVKGVMINDWSGITVSLSKDGSSMAVSSRFDNAGSDGGKVQVYTWTCSMWLQLGSDLEGEGTNDWFGYSTSLNHNGTVLAVGARRNSGNGNSSGHARIYEWNGTDWIQLGTDIDGEFADDESGLSISLNDDGTRLAIGAPFNSESAMWSGHTRIFEWNGTNWIQLGADIDGEALGDLSGWSVSLNSNGNRVAIGSRFNDNVNGNDAGHVRVFEWSGVSWIQLGADIDGELASDESGYSVSLNEDGNTVAIGAFRNDNINGTDAGHTRIFTWNGVNWTQLGVDIDGESAGDESGYSVSLNGDGTKVATGAYKNDNINGVDAGQTKIFEWNGTNWIQFGADIYGELTGDESGYSISLNDDGTKVAIGAYKNDNINGNDAGHVRVFSFGVPALINIWTGTTSTDWNNANNWTFGTVPNSTTNVKIPSQALGGQFPEIGVGGVIVNAEVLDIIIDDGAFLDIFTQSSLNVSGAFSNNGNVQMKSDVLGTAYFIDTAITSSYCGIGLFQIDQYIGPGSGLGQRLFGSPVENGVVSGLDGTYNSSLYSVGQLNPDNCDSSSLEAGSPYSALLEWNESGPYNENCYQEGWYAIAENSTLISGRAYSGWYTDGTTISFIGEPNTGGVQLSNLSRSSGSLPEVQGSHLVSNPYPSSINVGKLKLLNGADFINYSYYNSNQAYSGTYIGLMNNEYLGIAQGLSVETISNGNDFLFDNDLREIQNSTFKSTSNDYSTKLDIEISGNGFADITYLFFNDYATEQFDWYWDCEKRLSDAGQPSIFTELQNNALCLNGQSNSNMDFAVPLGVVPGANGLFTVTIQGVSSFDPTVLVFLKDKQTGNLVNIRENNNYTFNMLKNDNPDRFELFFTKAIAIQSDSESCDGNDGKLIIDFGNQSVYNNILDWSYSIKKENTIITNGETSGIFEVGFLEPGLYTVEMNYDNYTVLEQVLVETVQKVNALFEISDTIVELGQQLFFTNLSNDANSYEWHINGEVIMGLDATYSFLNLGEHPVSLFASNEECNDQHVKSVFVTDSEQEVSITSLDLNLVQIYSNNGFIVTDFTQTTVNHPLDVHIYNVLGMQVAKESVEQAVKKEFYFGYKPKGIYIIVVKSPEQTTTKKILLR